MNPAIPRHSRRAWLLLGLGTVAACAGARAAEATVIEERALGAFDTIEFNAAGELTIEASRREHITLEAEPAVLRKLTTEVRARRLIIGFMPGRIETNLPIRLRLELRSLREFELQGSGTVRVGALRTDTLALRLSGSGDVRLASLTARSLDVNVTGLCQVAVDGGRVETQRIAIDGSGSYSAPRLASERAEVTIGGNGEVHLAAAGRLATRIDGIGKVRYVGSPVVTQTIGGIGSVARVD